jgi:integrase/recombinase XerD
MSSLAPILQGFFTDRLIRQRHASPHTVASYRDTCRLLLGFAHDRTGKAPSRLELADLDATMIAAFLDHLETVRHNAAATRNGRLAAVHSLFRYAAMLAPEDAAVIQRVLAIPHKQTDRPIVAYLTPAEIDALLAAPDRSTWAGRRDHALRLVFVQTGVRVAELSALRSHDLELGTGPHIRVHGKDRKDRVTPLTPKTVAVLRVWLQENQGQPADVVFPSVRGTTLSHDAIGRLVAKHFTAAQRHCPSLGTKNVTPHVLRHSCAMTLLASRVDITVIALWLGHESIETTRCYVHANLALKEQALARTTPANTKSGRYKPTDSLLAFLEDL